MKISISEAKSFIKNYVFKLGFGEQDSKYIVENLIEAELSGKKSHGIVSLIPLKKEVLSANINVGKEGVEFSYPSKCLMLVNGRSKTGYSVIFQSLENSLTRAKSPKVLCVGIENFGYSSGYIGHYAKISAENNFLFIAFNKSPDGLVPHGAKKTLWGTNPLTIGIPGKPTSIILDMASSSVTWGSLLFGSILKDRIPCGLAIDQKGQPTTNPDMAMKGGILPIANHKGSGLAFAIELLAYNLVTSEKNYLKTPAWGCLYILIDPSLFLPLNVFKERVKKEIEKLKKLPRTEEVKEILFPGEKSLSLRSTSLKRNYLEIPDQLWKTLLFSFQDLKNPF